MIYQIALNIPLYQTFCYQMREDSALDLTGKLVLVPFGNKQSKKIAIVIEKANEEQIKAINEKNIKIKPIIEVLTPKQVLSELEINWLKTLSDYFHQPIGQMVFQALPKNDRNTRLKLSQKKPRVNPDLIYWQRTQESVSKLNEKQKLFLDEINSLFKNQPFSEKQIRSQSNNFNQLRFKKLKDLNLVNQVEIDFRKPKDLRNIILNDDQKKIEQSIKKRLEQFTIELIYGDTGSGKTEIYLNLINDVLKKGRQILFLVPEIGLIAQTKARIIKSTSLPVLSLYSGVGANEQSQIYEKIKSGEFAILVGTRSSVFVSFKNLGLIVIDEEHDNSYKQIDQLHYLCKEAAYLKAQKLNIPVMIGSATPSLETIKLVEDKKIKLHRLIKKNQFVNRRVKIINMQSEPKDRLLSSMLLETIKKHLELDQQGLLFLNRRGYAPLLKCKNCNWVQYCDDCDASMVFHHFDQMMHCHHCLTKKPSQSQCPVCSYKPLKLIGSGTEKLEKILKEKFIGTHIWRVDRDQTKKRGAMQWIFDSIESSKAGLIIGTQMLSKGHDFSKVSLVGLLDIDRMLLKQDIRSKELFSQLFIQVMGRTGRNNQDCEVVIQTRDSHHHLIKKLIHQGYDGFLNEALEEAKKYHLPPFAYQAACMADSSNKKMLYHFLSIWRKELMQFHFKVAIEIWQIQPAPIEKKSNRYHAYFLIYSKSRNTIYQALKISVNQILRNISAKNSVRYHFDINASGVDL